MNNKLLQINRLLSNARWLHTSKYKMVYEGSGKTTVTIINQESREKLIINKCLPYGFHLSNETRIIGPIVIFPKTILSWNIKSGEHINEGTLSLFLALDPRPDILILGLETQYKYSRILQIMEILKKRSIPVEILPVEKACAAYNFICDEGRYVAAGLIPPKLEDTHTYKRLQQQMKEIQDERLLQPV